MVIFLRILLVLLPLVMLLFWLKGRAKRAKGHEITDKDLLKARLTLAAFVVAIAAIGVLLRVTDHNSGATDQVYVPAKVVDGELVPGHFVPHAPSSETEPKSDTDTQEETDDPES